MKWQKSLLPIFLLFIAAGCESLNFNERDEPGIDFVNTKVEEIRDYLQHNEKLTEGEIEFIDNNSPFCSVYMWGTGSGAFGWWWDLPTNRRVIASYSGSIKDFDPNLLSSKFE